MFHMIPTVRIDGQNENMEDGFKMFKKVMLIFIFCIMLLANIIFGYSWWNSNYGSDSSVDPNLTLNYEYSEYDYGPVEFDCVPNEEIAIELGKIICQNKYPDFDYSNLSWHCIYDTNYEVWRVSCTDNIPKLGGGLPEIHIRKNNAQIVNIGLAA